MIGVGFEMKPIGDCVQEVSSWNPQRDGGEEEICYLDLSSVSQETKTVESHSRVLAKDAPSRARQLVRSGDILVSTVRPNLNGVARVPDSLDGATASTGFCVLRPDENKMHGEYLLHWVKTPAFVLDMTRKATGASYPAVSDRIIHESLLPLPPLPEQQRIAAILDQAEALRAKRRQALAKLDTLTQSLFLDLFGDPRPNPKGFTKLALGELIKVKSGESILVSQLTSNGKYPVYGGNGINGYHDHFMFELPVIVIGRVGVYCGAVHVSEGPAWVTDNALFVEKMSPDLNISYLAAALKFANLNQYAGRAAQPLVSGSRIYPVEILVPPRELQEDYAGRVAVLKRVKSIQDTSRVKFDALFASLQHRAFRGEL